MLEAVFLLLVLGAPDTLEVTVLDTGGEPVTEAVLELVPLTGDGESVLFPAEEGTVFLTVRGAFYYSVSAEGFITASGELSVPGEPVTVRLRRAAVFEGRVADETRAPVANARLALRRAGSEAVSALTAGGKDGRFRIGGMEPGLYDLRVEAEGHVPVEGLTVALRSGAATSRNIVLRRASRLDVLVRDPERKPVAGAALSVVTEGDDGRRLPEAERERLGSLTADTGTEGTATLGPLPRGVPVRVAARHAGFAPASVTRATSAGMQDIDLTLRPGGSLDLRLVDGEKAPVAGANLHLSSDDAPDLDLVKDLPTTGEDGALRLEHIPAGTYALRIQAGGLRPRTLRGVIIAEGGTARAGTVELLPGEAVAGKVLSEGGDPIPDAEVTAAFHEEGRELEAKDETDGEGAFRIEGLPPRTVEVRVEAEGFLEKVVPRVPAGKEDLEVRLRPAGSVTATVVDAGTGDPVTSFRVTPAPQRAGRSGRRRERHRDIDDPEGRIVVEPLTEGTWVLHVAAPGYRPAASDPVEVAAGEESDAGTIEMDRGLRLEGRVLDAAEGTPVAGAEVGAGSMARTLSDAEGLFRLEGLASPTPLTVEHAAYVQEALEEVDIEQDPFVTVRLERGGRIEGTVYGEDGEPLPGAEVGTWQRKVRTDGNGHYLLEGMRPGRVGVDKVEVPGTYRGQETAFVEVKAGETARLDFGAGARLEGKVTHDGGPASGAMLTLYEVRQGSQSSSRDLRTRTAATGESGRYVFPGLAEGTYSMAVSWEGRHFGRELSMGRTDQILDIEVPDLEISGTVLEAGTDRPLGGARVVAYASRDRGAMTHWDERAGGLTLWSTSPIATDVSDTEGRFRLILGEKGKWSVSAELEGYTSEEESSRQVDVQGRVTGVVLRMKGSATLTVRLVDAATGGSPTSVMISMYAGSGSTAMGVEGSAAAVFRNVRPGEVRIQGSADTYAPAWRRIEMEAGEDREEVLKIDHGGTARILVPPGFRLEGRPWEWGLGFIAEDGTDLTRSYSLEDVEQEEGVFLIRHLPDGPLTFRRGKKDGSVPQRETTVIVPLGGEVTANLR